MKILYARLDRDLKRGLYLDFKLLVEKSENDKIIEIFDEDGTKIYSTEGYMKTGDEIYDTAYIPKDFFKDNTTQFILKATDSEGTTVELGPKIITKTYKVNIDNIEVRPVRNDDYEILMYKTYIRWNYDNFSIKDLIVRALLYPIKDEDKDISYDVLPNDYRDPSYIRSEDMVINARELSIQKVTCIDVSPNKLFSSSIGELKSSVVLYRLAIRNSDGKNNYYPEKGAFRYRASNQNEAPVIKLENIDVVKKGDSFQLSMDSLLRDSSLDDVRYTIHDNHGNVVFQHDYYSYTPRIDKIVFNYDSYNFNSLFLKLNAEISDNLNFSYKRSFTYALFEVNNIRIRRDRLLWDVRNYSNNMLKTNVEILNMKNEVVYSGDILATRLEKDPVTITDDKPIALLQELDEEEFYQYYKFRIKVRCDDENYTGYVEFKNGTLVSTQHHNAAEITIYHNQYPDDYHDETLKGKSMRHLERDDDNNKKIKLIFDLDPHDGSAIGDYCQYTVSDDSGNVIYQSKDTITLPQRVELYMPYDFTKKLYNTITVTCINEYGNVSNSSVEIPSYYIMDAEVITGTQKISFKADNYYDGDITVIAEVHDLYVDGKKLDFETQMDDAPIIREQETIIGVSEKTTQHYIRLLPKIYYDNYGVKYKMDALKCRLRIEGKSEEDEIRYEDRFVDVKRYLEPRLNTKPSIMVNYSNNEIDPETNTLSALLNVSFADGDGDWINYEVSDRYGTIASRELFDMGTDNVETVTLRKNYNLNELESSMIQWNLMCFDEEGLYEGFVHKIPLHYISNLIFENNTLQYKCKLFTNKPIYTLLEILDDEGYLYARGKEVAVNYLEDMKVVEETISIKKFKPGNYRYRIKVRSANENWQLFYPNLNGEVIHITQEMIDADRTRSNTLTTNEISTMILDELNEYKTLLGQRIQLGTYTSNENTILGRLYNTMEALNGENRTNAIIELLDIFSNHHDSLTIDLREYGSHLLSSTIIEGNVEMEVMKGYTNYAMDITNYLYNISGYPLEFKIKEKNHLPYEKYQARLFSNGKKILDHKTNAQILNDGLAKVYVGTDDVPNNSCIEIETHKNLLDHAESEIHSFKIVDHEQIVKLRTTGIIVEGISQYYLNNNLIAYIERGGNRINLFRSNVRKGNSSFTVLIQDSVYIGDTIKIVTNTIAERQYVNTSYVSGQSRSAKAVKPIYFIPLSFIDVNGNIIDISNEDLRNNLDVYIGGYTAVPNKDYTIIPKNDDMDLPPMLLFRHLLFADTDVEVYFRNRDKSGSNVYIDILPNVNGYYYLDMGEGYTYPLVKGMFTVYCNNKKVPSDEIIVLNRRFLAFKKNVITTKNHMNFYVKVNYPDNPIVDKLLELYSLNPPSNDSQSIGDLLNSISDADKKKLLQSSNVEDDNDILHFLIYVYDLYGSENFKFLREMKKKLANSSNVFKTYGLDCSRTDLLRDIDVKDVIMNNTEVPKYFNHNINIFGSSNLFEYNNIEDNISIGNPSRVLQLSNYLEQGGNIIDCSVNINNDDYDVFLNEGLDIEMDYIVKDIELDRNI